MKKIYDYEELNYRLNNLNHIHEEEILGKTQFGLPIRLFTFGNGKNHVIITAGTHSQELITVHFVIEFMEFLDQNPDFIDANKFTLHFIPILNPEGNLIITSAIRSKLKRNVNELDEQTFCKDWYKRCKNDDENKEIVSQKFALFEDVDENCIDAKYMKIRNNVKKIIELSNSSKGSIISWNSNGNGVNLNDNSPKNKFIKDSNNNKFKNMLTPNPFGAIFAGSTFSYELENEYLLKFYNYISTNYNLVGSIIYHSCGGLIRYLEKLEDLENPWNNNIEEKIYQYHLKVAESYSKFSNYTLVKTLAFNTISSQLESKYPGTILVELGKIRGNPLGQFINDNNLYDNLMNDNKLSLRECINEMAMEYDKYKKGKYL